MTVFDKLSQTYDLTLTGFSIVSFCDGNERGRIAWKGLSYFFGNK
jgi:hypothetical protein